MLCTEIVSDIQKIFVHNMFSPYSAKRRASDKDLPVPNIEITFKAAAIIATAMIAMLMCKTTKLLFIFNLPRINSIKLLSSLKI